MRILRRNLYNLHETHKITNPRSETRSFFEYNGYCLFRNRIQMTETNKEIVQSMKNQFENENYSIVFNEGTVSERANHRTAERLQIITDSWGHARRGVFDYRTRNFLRHVKDRTKECGRLLLTSNHDILTTETVLYSRSRSRTIQDPHRDLDTNYVGNSLLAFSIIHPDTTLIIYPGSHLLDKPSHANRVDHVPRRYGFEVGDILIFHPRLIHCGDAYVNSNIRIHYYLFALPLFQWQDVTFPLRLPIIKLLQLQMDRQDRAESRRAGQGRRRLRMDQADNARQRNLVIARSYINKQES